MNVPKIAIVGRPNVGKSTLFNRLIGRRQAIVDDIPGVTRDRQYGICDWDGQSFFLIDTGGFVPGSEKTDLSKAVLEQVLLAIEEAAAVIFVADGRFGISNAEQEIADLLRKQKIPVILAVNKIDGDPQKSLIPDFYRLGFPQTIGISGESSHGLSELLDALLPILRERDNAEAQSGDLKLAIIGQPNVGKSTLLNALVGENRAVVHPKAGTTLDPLSIYFERGSRILEIVDTAGIRRRSHTEDKIEKVSVLKAFQSIRLAHLVLLLVDATKGLTAQDTKILSYALEQGKGILLVYNKWDLMPPGSTIQESKKQLYDRFKRFDDWPVIALSAKTGRGIRPLLKLIDTIDENYHRRVGTGELNRVFQKATNAHPHPISSGQNVQLFYITQSESHPPRFTIFSNKPKLIKEEYLRYLERIFRKSFDFTGAPIRWSFKAKRS